MKNLKNLSDNELSEMISCLKDCIVRIEENYGHISDNLLKELRILKNKHSRLCDEYELREDED